MDRLRWYTLRCKIINRLVRKQSVEKIFSTVCLLGLLLLLFVGCSPTRQAQRKAERHIRKARAVMAAYPELTSSLDTTYTVTLKSLPQQHRYTTQRRVLELMNGFITRDSVPLLGDDGSEHFLPYQLQIETDSLGEVGIALDFDSLAASASFQAETLVLDTQPRPRTPVSWWQRALNHLQYLTWFSVISGAIALFFYVFLRNRRKQYTG